ncbi:MULTISPECIES: ATP-binding protein [unclassified Streptomyces]|uniref:ATP-binding protein n=1 Tax=unclassified Streptomyces TaxID=2593676 RepID=UPI0023650D4C|nr:MULTISPECIES: ATP-binding protein [unclassified Streptomyces]MDF3149544.1 ATP-binding protein [Streptomyces sp. T21Q-yed]WDF35375.1 ATP-binding protein [Streptomyces sp. T12]
MNDKYRTGATKSPAGAGRVRHGSLSPAEARGAVRRVLSEQSRARGTACGPDTLSDALLVASELTTNAMLHGGGVTGFDVEVVGQNLYLSVSDRERRRPVAVDSVDRHGRHRCGGRGWPIVCRLSRTVLVSDLPAGGKRITAVIALPAQCRYRVGGS